MDRGKSEADGRFDKAPIWNWNDGKLKFDTNDVANVNKQYGSGSAFVPKFLLQERSLKEVSVLCPTSAFAHRLYPPAEHAADLVEGLLDTGILSDVYGSHVFHEAHKEAEEIELYARAFEKAKLINARESGGNVESLEELK